MEAVTKFAVKQLTEKLDEKAAIVDQYSPSMNLYVHLDKHLGSVQMADEQLLSTCCREGSEWTPAAVFIPVGSRERHCGLREGFS